MSTEKQKKKDWEEYQKEIAKLLEDMTEEAKLMVEDYVKNPSEMSGSITQVHESSKLLKDKDESK
tara:strand:- start:2730 stop:2924 length:195 start_codon:yes stop_codon:yes gene_type:complete